MSSRALITFFVSLIVLFPALALASPKAEFSSTSFDFGTVSQGDKVEQDFVITNSGNEELQIRRIQPSCGCTAVILESDVIPIGGSTTIKAQFDTTGFQGYKVKTIRVYTNDPTNSSSVLTLRGTIRADIELNPQRVNFGKVQKGVLQSARVAINSSINNFIVKSANSRSEDIEVKLSTESGKQVVTVLLKDTTSVGVFRGRVSLTTNQSQTPVLTIPVFAQVVGDIALSESSVSFGLLDAPLNAAVSKKITLTNNADFPVQISSVVSKSPEIAAEVSTLEEGRLYEVNVTLKGASAGAVRGRVEVTTNHPDEDQRKLVLPVFAIINPPSNS